MSTYQITVRRQGELDYTLYGSALAQLPHALVLAKSPAITPTQLLQLYTFGKTTLDNGAEITCGVIA